MEPVLYRTPELTEADLAVVAGIEEHRKRLRFHVSNGRRWRGRLRRDLRARAMRGSNSIEGYDVSLDDAIDILRGDDEVLDADQRTVLEVTGYRNAMTYVVQLGTDPDFVLDPSLVRSLHFMMLGHDLTKSPGAYRKSAIFVHDDERGEIVYEGPDAELVPSLMEELLHGLVETADDPASIFVTAAMAHLNLVMVHPFRDGNGRMARCLQTLILARSKVLGAEFSSIEEWLGRNTQAYYDVLARTGRGVWAPGNDAAEWVRFNLTAHHMQAQTVWRRIQIADRLWQSLEVLAQERGLPERTVSALFDAARGRRLRRSAYQEDQDLEAGTANRDLKTLTAAGLITAHGQTRGRFYLGTPVLRAFDREIRQEYDDRVIDPYDAEPADDLAKFRHDAEGDRLL